MLTCVDPCGPLVLVKITVRGMRRMGMTVMQAGDDSYVQAGDDSNAGWG